MPMWLFDFIDELFMPNPEKDDRKRYTQRLGLGIVLGIIVVWLFG